MNPEKYPALNPALKRYVVRVNLPGKPELASYAVYASSSLAAYHKAVAYVQHRVTATVLGEMGPDGDDGFQDAVIR